MPAVLLGGRFRRRAGGSAPPTTNPVGATLATETWTDNDGAAWPSQWTSGSSGLASGATRTIQGGRGRLTPNGTYAGHVRGYLDGMTATADVDLLVDAYTSGDAGAIVAVRASSVDANHLYPVDGYIVDLYKTSAYLKKLVGGTETQLGVWTLATPGRAKLRLRVVGSLITAKTWEPGAAEPSDWSVSVADSTVFAPGKVWLAAGSGGSTGYAEFDNLTVRAGNASSGGDTVIGAPPTQDTTVPGVPTAVTATSTASGQAQIDLQPPTTDGGDPVGGYYVGRDGKDVFGAEAWSTTIPADQRSFTFLSLDPAFTYTLSVAAINGRGRGQAATVSVTPNGGGTTPPPVIPPATGDPAIAPPSSGSFTLTPIAGGFSWDHEDVPAPGNNFGRYERRVGTTNPPTGQVVSTDYTSGGSAVGLPQTPHYLQVRSVTASGLAGVWSAVQGPVTPLAAPTAPPVTVVGAARNLPHPFWTTPLRAEEPLAAMSADFVSRLAYQASMDANKGQNPGAGYPYPYNHELSTGGYSICVYSMPPGWPRQKVWHTRTRGGGFQQILDRGVPVPDASELPGGTLAPGGTDGSIIILDLATQEQWEFWIWRPSGQAGYTWECEQGGYIANRSKHPGWWSGGEWAHNFDRDPYRPVRKFGYDWGISAAGKSYLGALLTAEDFYADAIRHPLSVAVPITGGSGNYPSLMLPATRFDHLTFSTGSNADSKRLPEGARFRLPHSFNIEAWVSQKAIGSPSVYGTTAAVLRKVLVCLRDYGVLIGDTAGVVQIMGEHDKVYGTRYHPYTIAQRPNWGNFGQQIPWSSLVQIAPPSVDISEPGAGPA